mmetsp:Transcript_42575/g.127673  ORF Transcript_42575/g.127673 Transcript_42575/m.127673 type:complete len:269 (-) Transcript_42575:907-1713(-)
MVGIQKLALAVHLELGMVRKELLDGLQRPGARPPAHLGVLHNAVRSDGHHGAVQIHLLEHVRRCVVAVQQDHHLLPSCHALDLVDNGLLNGATLQEMHMLVPQLVLGGVVADATAPRLALLPCGLNQVDGDNLCVVHFRQMQDRRPQQRAASICCARLHHERWAHSEEDVLDGVHVERVLHRDDALPVLALKDAQLLVEHVQQKHDSVLLWRRDSKRHPVRVEHALRAQPLCKGLLAARHEPARAVFDQHMRNLIQRRHRGGVRPQLV